MLSGRDAKQRYHAGLSITAVTLSRDVERTDRLFLNFLCRGVPPAEEG